MGYYLQTEQPSPYLCGFFLGRYGTFLLPVDIEYVDRDDPTKLYENEVDRKSANLLTTIFYAGSPEVQDHVSFTVPATLNLNVINWRAEPVEGFTGLGTITGPLTGNEWILDGGTYSFDWEPGQYNIMFDIGATSVTVGLMNVGVRTDDYLTIAWINPDEVTLDESGVQDALTEVFKPGGMDGTSDNDKLKAGLLTSEFIDGNINEPFQVDLGPIIIGVDFEAFSDADKKYAINWLFKYGGNPAPPDSFVDSEGFFDDQELDAFAENEKRTFYKLINHFQAKFEVNQEQQFKPSSITYLDNEVFLGNTKDPTQFFDISGPIDFFILLGASWLEDYPDEGAFVGTEGPHHSNTPAETGTETKLCVEGRPDAKGLAAEAALTGEQQGQIWSSTTFFSDVMHYMETTGASGTLTREPKPLQKPSDARVNTQVYPTYWVYINGQTAPAFKQAQAPEPGALFPNTDECQ